MFEKSFKFFTVKLGEIGAICHRKFCDVPSQTYMSISLHMTDVIIIPEGINNAGIRLTLMSDYIFKICPTFQAPTHFFIFTYEKTRGIFCTSVGDLSVLIKVACLVCKYQWNLLLKSL